MKRKIQDCLAYRLFFVVTAFLVWRMCGIKAPVDYVNPYMGNISHFWYRLIRLSIYLTVCYEYILKGRIIQVIN
jgi:hypothetical protein